MRQTLLLNIAVFGFFVLLFASLYRHKPLHRLKFWIGAWLWIALHFLLLLWDPQTGFWKDTGATSALMLSGVWFLLSVPVRSERARNITAIALSMLCITVVVFLYNAVGPPSMLSGWITWAALLTEVLLQATALLIVWSYEGRPSQSDFGVLMRWRVPGTMLILVSGIWSTLSLWRGNQSVALDAMLMEVFAAYALLFLQEFPPRTAGALTTVFGLVAWAAVFPVSLAVAGLWPHFQVQPEIWDVPKVFVAFGMLVTLLEDEQARSEREREQYRFLFDSNPLAMWIYDPASMCLTETNQTATRDFGWSREELPGLTLRDLMPDSEITAGGLFELNQRLGNLSPSEIGSRARVHPSEPNVRANSVKMKTKDGRELVAEATIQGVRFSERESRLLIANDITAQMEAHRQLIHIANHDPLTGMPNRLLLRDRMESAVANAQRRGRKAAVLCIDLDRFKQINDNFGHAAGDSCLCEVARRLEARLRATDTAARTGGEEFVIILDDLSNLDDVGRVAQDVLTTLGAPHTFGDAVLHLSASIGIAIYPDDGMEPSVLWSRADAVMYRAKQRGGNRWLLFSSAQETEHVVSSYEDLRS
jgi:diguanylate cyclase (GGDEF)-like protein